METKHAVITAVTVLSAGIIGAVALHGLLNRYEIFSESGSIPVGYRLNKVMGEIVYLEGSKGLVAIPTHKEEVESD